MNQDHLRRYAQLLVEHGVGLRRGQPLYVYGQTAHRELLAMLTEVAYTAGSGAVETRCFDPLLLAALIRHGRTADVELHHAQDTIWFREIIRHGAAYISLQGPELPLLWEGLARTCPDRFAAFHRGLRAATDGFLRYGLEGQHCPWVAAPCPTPGWARQVFPELAQDAAYDRLAALIFHFTGADREDARELAAAKDRRLKARCRSLDELEIRQLHVLGEGADLRIGLSRQARWLGGSLKTATGQTFYRNLPSEEVYTTPDRRLTEGRLAITRPLRINRDTLVSELVLYFKGGRVIDFEAGGGADSFERWLEVDEGARYLGEIGLVGEDSLIAASGLFFDLALLDENAAAHVALGKSYAGALAGGETMSPRALEALGFNPAPVHLDVLFGAPEVKVVATRSQEGEVALIDSGRWTESLG
ncbi:MAG: aminopeptidase [bacterium]|nr:aminopeptidase [bacterium]